MHTVVVVAVPDVVPSDLSAPCDLFAHVRLAGGAPAYRVRVAGAVPTVHAGWFDIVVPHGLDALAEADTIVIPGTTDATTPPDPRLLAAIRAAAARGARVASICTGAFLLAATGLLDGRRATTHWRAAAELARRFPAVRVDPDVLYVDEGAVLTSAGAAAGLDLCLHLVRRDHGSAVAADAARFVVMPPERAGGQAQFIVHPAPSDGTSLQPLLRWLEASIDRPVSLDGLATRAGLSPRSLTRRFREQTGSSPLQWVLRARVRRAQQLLETTRHPVDEVARASGFGSATALREQFQRVLATSPQAYRRAFQGRGTKEKATRTPPAP